MNQVNLICSYENHLLSKYQKKYILPLTIITGNLGAGKTSCLKHISNSKNNLKIITLINDYSNFNIDYDIIQYINDKTYNYEPNQYPNNDKKKDILNSDNIFNSNNLGFNKTLGLEGSCLCCSNNLKNQFKNNIWNILQAPDRIANGMNSTSSSLSSPSSSSSSLSKNSLINEIYDYLVIETSGLSDPYDIIELVEAKFGKMLRARLDSIVTVLDSDAIYNALNERYDILYNNINNNKEKKMKNKRKKMFTLDLININKNDIIDNVLLSQIELADIILFNKIDLFENPQEELNILKDWIYLLNPDCKIFYTSFGKIPLHEILDIGLPDNTGSTISHEKSSIQLYVKPNGGNLRKKKSNKSSIKKRKLNNNKIEIKNNIHINHNHHHQNTVHSISYVNNNSFDLLKFQNYLSNNLNSLSIIRMKGFISFSHNNNIIGNFNMSGRGRYEYEIISDNWVGDEKIKLVIIGKNMNEDEIINELNELIIDNNNNNNINNNDDDIDNNKDDTNNNDTNTIINNNEEILNIINIIKLNKRFELEQLNNNILLFRLTSKNLYTLNEDELKLRYGVNLNNMNLELLRKLNFQGGKKKLFFTYIKYNDKFYIQYAINNLISFQKIWDDIEKIADKIFKKGLKPAHQCKCHF